jgi:hypothetical protein
MIGANPFEAIFNQFVVIIAAIFGGLYIYRSIETRIVALEGRVSVLENIYAKEEKNHVELA